MKYIFSTLFIICSFILNAQDFYINLQTGYGFVTEAGQANFFNIDMDNNTETREIITGGFGEGNYFRGNFGYNYNATISFEFGFNYLLGKTIVREENYNFSDFNGGYINEIDFSQNIRAFMFIPQLVVKIPSESNLKPFVKAGLAVGTFMKSTTEYDFFAKGPINSTTIEIDNLLEGGTPLGFVATLGTSYLINEHFALVADFSLLNMSYRPYKSTVIKYIRDGVDEYNNLTLREREILYSNKVEIDNNTLPNDNEARRELPVSLPMSNVTFNIGLQVNL
ncbi:MAG: outer membrane beta-barrel protein [Saprospiraceae bacterium]